MLLGAPCSGMLNLVVITSVGTTALCLCRCYSVKAETLEYFKKLTAGQVLLLQVMKEDHKRNVLEVDLVRLEEDDVCYTSVRDCLVFAGQAVLETNPYSAVPSLNTRGYELPGQPRAGTRHEVHVSHVPDPRPGRRLQLHVQVSPASMDLPLLSERYEFPI